MNSKPIWSDLVPEKDSVKNPVNDVAFSGDGTRVIVGVGNRVLLYNAENGDLIESLRGHKDTVNSVDFSSDGSRFASGGNDNVVVIWKITGQGMLKYNHMAPIQRVKYNPTTLQLASCSDVDFGLWTPEQKQVMKEKVTAKILSVAWSTDGSTLALGLQNGVISIRNQQAEEVQRIERKAPIWSLIFVPTTAQTGKGSQVVQSSAQNSVAEGDTLAVGCWDKVLSFYRIQGSNHRLQSEKSLKYYPCSISLAGSQGNKANYLVITGSDKKATLYSRDGMKLFQVANKNSWVWGSACHSPSDRVVIGCDNGGIEMLQMSFTAVHSLFRDRYAYRENLTEIIVHHLVNDRKVRIKCKDLVQRIALYKNKLAVQLTDRVCIYESSADESTDMHFRLRRERIAVGDKPCELMVVTSTYLIFCRSNAMELYSFDGFRHRVWIMDAPIKYVKVEGGFDGKEALLIGVESGVVTRVFVDNPFPVELTRRASAVVQADISLNRTKLASVDTSNILTVTDLRTQEVLYTATDVVSAHFNTEVDDMLCYTGENSIFVVSGIGSVSSDRMAEGSSPQQQPQPQEQHISGLAIGFQGQKIYYLYRGSIMGVDVPQGVNMLRALDSADYRGAYSIACLGATESDWRLLGMRALRANSLVIAKNAFSRLRESKFLSLIEMMERGSAPSVLGSALGSAGSSAPDEGPATTGERRGGRHRPQPVVAISAGGSTADKQTPLDPSWQAEIMAYEGHHHEAAKMYARAGKIDAAIRLFTDLRRWNDAKMFAQNAGQSAAGQGSLTMQQAKWLQEINDWRGASELYLSLGQHMQAAKIVAEANESGWPDVLIEVVRATPVDNKEVLHYCGERFTAGDEDVFARETYSKLQDYSKLMSLYARKQMWSEAAKLADEHEGEFDVSVFLPYAEWLVVQDRYEDAMQAYKKAGRRDLARKVLGELTQNAVSEYRFKDAAYYYWVMAKEAEGDDALAQSEAEHKADLYFAYASVHAFVTDPFTSHQPEMLFQVSRFIINSLGSSEAIPHGISKAATLYTLARQAMLLGAFKLARHAYDRLGKLQLPTRKQDEIELDMLVVQAKPVRDDPDHLPVCYRCSSTNPLLNPFTNKFAKGDVCTNCGHPFVRSFINFDILPLVEFVPHPSISDEEAIELIRQPPSEGRSKAGGRGRGKDGDWREGKDGESDTMVLDSAGYDETYDSVTMGGDADLFMRALNTTLENQNNSYHAVTVDANTLISIERSTVFVCRPSSKTKRATFYRNMLPEIAIAISQPCHRFFHLEDFEFSYLSSKHCPYSRLKNVGEYGSL